MLRRVRSSQGYSVGVTTTTGPGYYHTGISVGDGKIITLGSDGLILEDATGAVGGCFPSAGYSEVNYGDYRYSNTNPAPQGH